MRPAAPPAGPWVEQWLTPSRFARYLTCTGGDQAAALDLYEWNVQTASAVLHDLAHLEVALRNAYARVLGAADSDWTNPSNSMWAPLLRSRGQGQVDINERMRSDLQRARQKAGPHAPSGKVVAELMFGFWRYLSSSAHEKRIWVPHLHRAFPAGTDRHTHVDNPLSALNRLRNRAAHHEHLLTEDLQTRHDDVIGLADRLDPDLGQYLRATALIPRQIPQRPA